MSHSIEKVWLIQSSLRCFVFGLVALVPILGVPFVLLTLVAFLRARALIRGKWNPAGFYLYAGLASAAVGALISAVILLSIASTLIAAS